MFVVETFNDAALNHFTLIMFAKRFHGKQSELSCPSFAACCSTSDRVVCSGGLQRLLHALLRTLFLPYYDLAYVYLHNLNISYSLGKPEAPRGYPRHSVARGHADRVELFYKVLARMRGGAEIPCRACVRGPRRDAVHELVSCVPGMFLATGARSTLPGTR